MPRFARLLALLVALLPSCSGTETGNPTPPGKLSLGLRSSDESQVALGMGTAPLVVDGYFQVLGTLAYQKCPAGSDEIVSLLEATRTPVELTSGAGLSVEHDLPEGDYCGAWMAALTAVKGDAVPDGLLSDRLLITGVREDGTPFEVHTDADLRIKLRVATPLPRRDGRVSAVLALDVAAPLATLDIAGAVPDADGTVRIFQRMRDGTLTAEFGAALLASGVLFDDLDDNGRFDAGEPQIAP
jgi:hypothetical protein